MPFCVNCMSKEDVRNAQLEVKRRPTECDLCGATLKPGLYVFIDEFEVNNWIIWKLRRWLGWRRRIPRRRK